MTKEMLPTANIKQQLLLYINTNFGEFKILICISGENSIIFYFKLLSCRKIVPDRNLNHLLQQPYARI